MLRDDPAVAANVVREDAPVTETVVTAREQWSVRRVYSQYTSREVFTAPNGAEYVRVSRDAYDPARGDVAIAMMTRGLLPLLLRRRDALAKNLQLAAVTP